MWLVPLSRWKALLEAVPYCRSESVKHAINLGNPTFLNCLCYIVLIGMGLCCELLSSCRATSDSNNLDAPTFISNMISPSFKSSMLGV